MKLTGGLLGQVSGKCKNLVFRVSKRRNIVQSINQGDKVSKSELQVLYRTALTHYSAIYARLVDSFITYFLFFPLSMGSRRNYFLHLNLINKLPSGLVDYSKLIVSIGDLTPRSVTSYSLLVNPRRLRVRFSTVYDGINSFANDYCKGFLYNSTRDEIAYNTYTSYRSQGWLDFNLPDSWLNNDTVYVYSLYANSTYTRVSNNSIRKIN